MDRRAFLRWSVGVGAALLGSPGSLWKALAWEQRDEIYRRRAPYLWAFYKRHPEDYRLTASAHWAHGRISDVIMSTPYDQEAIAEADARFVEQANALLKRPAQVEPKQQYVGPAFARLAPLAPKVIDWTHELHEGLYDLMAEDRLTETERLRYIQRETDYYLNEPGFAFSPAPLDVIVNERLKLMGQPWFRAFRTQWPKATGLFWAFHWWHPAVYEAQVVYGEKQRAAILEIDEVFNKEVVPNPPNRMLLSRELMPRFSRMAPEAANIFDNLHQFHGIVYDILASPLVKDKQAELYRMIGLMLSRPGDRELAGPDAVPFPHPDLDPLAYDEWMWAGHGEMGRIMGMGAGEMDMQEHRRPGHEGHSE